MVWYGGHHKHVSALYPKLKSWKRIEGDFSGLHWHERK